VSRNIRFNDKRASHSAISIILTVAVLISLAGCVYPTVEGTGTPPEPAVDLGEARAHLERGRALIAQGQLEQAIAELDRAIELDPDEVEVYVTRGFAYIALGQFERGIADYDTAIELESDNPILYNDRGFAYAELGKYERAVADYDKAIELDPDYDNVDYAYNNRGFAYGSLGKYEQAFSDFERAIALNPDNAWVYYNRALIHIDMGQSTDAIPDLELSLQLENPPLDPKRRAKAEGLLKQIRTWGLEV
jgi:tetratricopeptide (TPR) repeat protein